MDSYEYTEVAAAAVRVVEALRAELRSRGITEYAVVDHGHDMAAAGVTPHPAWTLVFGNPAAGEALLARELAAAVDIPLRLAVIGRDDGRSAIVLRPMESLLEPELAEVAGRLTGVLRALAGAARGRAQEGASA
jgi:uncharacterized protein (DUF302 family)